MKRFILVATVLVGLLALHVGCKKKKSKSDKDSGPRYSKRDLDGCAGNLKQMGLALLGYSGDYGGFFPPDLGKVAQNSPDNPLGTNDLPASKVYVCPADDDTEYPATGADINKGMCSYQYVGSGLRDDNVYSTTVPVVKCACGKHGPLGVPTLYIDGHVVAVQKDGTAKSASSPRRRRRSSLFR